MATSRARDIGVRLDIQNRCEEHDNSGVDVDIQGWGRSRGQSSLQPVLYHNKSTSVESHSSKGWFRNLQG